MDGKLVRDNIPSIIQSEGRTCDYIVLTGMQYRHELMRKLFEEIQEYNESQDIEELADIIEVVYALAALDPGQDIDDIRERKHRERGGFEKGYFLCN